MSSYIDLMNRFWRLDMEARFTPIETKLYFAVLHIANSLWWKQPLTIPNKRLLAMVECTEPTFIKARQRINDLGLIIYKKGTTRKAGRYFIVEDYLNDFSNEYSNGLSNGLSNPFSNPLSNLFSNQQSQPAIQADLGLPKTRQDKDNNIYIGAGEIEKIVLLWKEFQLSLLPTNMTKTNETILNALRAYGYEQVARAIRNYSEIVNGKGYILDTRWQLSSFLEKHIEKFLDIESARQMYKGGGNGSSGKSFAGNGSKTSRTTERPDREHYTGGKYGGFFETDGSSESG